MPTDLSVLVSGIGLVTPVGLNSAQTCAALRAGIPAISELEFAFQNEDLETEAVLGCVVPNMTPGYVGLGRAARLMTAAVRDLTSTARLTNDLLERAALYIALPSPSRGGVDPSTIERIGRCVAQALKAPTLEHRIRICPEGHAAAARLMLEASAHLNQGIIDYAIVCGVDSLVERDVLDFLMAKRRIKTGSNVDAFVPGEAAACLLLELASTARRRRANVLASVDGVGAATESTTVWSQEPPTASGLTEAVRQALSSSGDRSTRVIVTDLNGETYRAKEYSLTAARALSQLSLGWSLWHPADCIGDTGAASFVINACVGTHGLARGYAKSDRVLVLGSSDEGCRGALSLCRVHMEV